MYDDEATKMPLSLSSKLVDLNSKEAYSLVKLPKLRAGSQAVHTNKLFRPMRRANTSFEKETDSIV